MPARVETDIDGVDMKRVAIVTIHAIRNYGSVLQAYATQEVVRKLGCSPVIIDYAYPNPIHRQLLSAKGRVLRSGNRLFMILLGAWPLFSRREVRYSQFIQNNMNLSRHYASRDELIDAPPYADIYISGSDQIWHPRCIDYDETFLLDFVPQGKKKVAFASSFGVDTLSENQRVVFQKQLPSYDCIAVREASGQKLVHELIGTNTQQVLDPTLLLSAEEWTKIENPVKIDEPYILLYGNMTSQGSQMNRFAFAIQRLTGFKIVRIHGKAYNRLSRKIRYLFDVGPEEFLWLFRNASFVLANSFHGTVFSILFNRQFLSFYPGASDMGTRQRNILELLDLQNRGVALPLQGGEGEVLRLIEDRIDDYKRPRKALASLRKKTLSWLADALG